MKLLVIDKRLCLTLVNYISRIYGYYRLRCHLMPSVTLRNMSWSWYINRRFSLWIQLCDELKYEKVYILLCTDVRNSFFLFRFDSVFEWAWFGLVWKTPFSSDITVIYYIRNSWEVDLSKYYTDVTHKNDNKYVM